LVARPRLATALLVAGVVVATLYLAYLGLVKRSAFLPAPVHAAHASIEHDCEKCHDTWSGVSNAKCAGCHEDAHGAEIAWKGFAKHHAQKSLDCTACHTDHKGRRGETTTISAEAYKAACEKCHEGYEKQKGAFRGVLVWDHKDHTAAQGLRCEQCHDARPAERAHHGEVTIGRPDCFNVACHVKPLKKPADFVLAKVSAKHAAWNDDCFSCHTWLGSIDSGKCASCHDDGKGGPLALAGFASHHARRDLDCARCHTEHAGDGHATTRETQEDYAASCTLCHAGFEATPHTIRGDVFLHASHGAKQKLACADCHDMRKDAPKHGAVTLETNACVACHMRRDHPAKKVLAEPWREVTASHAAWENDCARCHSAAADTRGALCADCHKRPDGSEIAWTGFAKHHLDPTLACAECHTEHKGRAPPPGLIAAADYREKCTLCHARFADFEGQVDGHPFKHKGHTPAQGLRCEQCHDARTDAREAHGKLTTGTGSCVTCHLTKKADTPVLALAKGHAGVKDCWACHTDWHKADDALCRACHEAERAKRPAPREKLFPAHAVEPALACLGCHTDHKGPGASTERLPEEARTATCLRCHAAPGGGKYAQPVERSPRRLPARDPLIGAPADEVFDHAQHADVACERCHDPDVKRHARAPGAAGLPLRMQPGDCISCHHGPDMKKDCASCHAAEAKFRGGASALVSTATPADPHVGLVQCAECHVRDALGQFAPTREACVRCHGEDFGGLYDSLRASLAAAIKPATPPDIALTVRRCGLHNPTLARLLLSREAPPRDVREKR
jgi:hypothetical protein